MKLNGVGIGLRPCHYEEIQMTRPSMPFFEVLSDNYLHEKSLDLYHLEKISSHYPITFHGVGMSIGSTDKINMTYLKKLKNLINQFNPLLVSDHLSWSALNGHYFHELLPLPYTEEAIQHTAKRIRHIQEFLERKIMIENVSNYLQFSCSQLKEWEFLKWVADEADCLILLDINNIYVSSVNNHFDAYEYLNQLNTNRITQFHLAGHEDKITHLLDTHGEAINPSVWDLYQYSLNKFGCLPTVIERDNHIPEFSILLHEAKHAQSLMDKYANTL